MTAYYVSKLGNDSNAGTSAAAAFLTIGAAEDAATSAGDIVYVAPGTYRERVTNGSSGVNGSPITFEGDPNSRHFGDTVVPGQVRVTGNADFDRQSTTGAVWMMNTQTFVTVRGFIIDGAAHINDYRGCVVGGTGGVSGTLYGYEGQLLENCMISSSGASSIFKVRTVRRCTVASATISIDQCGYVFDTFVASGNTAFIDNYMVLGCVAIGANAGFLYNHRVAHCSAYFCRTGFRTSDEDEHYVVSCEAQFCYYGFAGTSATNTMSPGRCLASTCGYVSYDDVDGDNATGQTDPFQPTFFSGGVRSRAFVSEDTGGTNKFYGVEIPTSLFYASNMMRILKALKMPHCPGIMGSAYARDYHSYDLDGYQAADDCLIPGQWRYGHASGSFKDDYSSGSPHHSGSGVGTDILGNHIFTGDNVSGTVASPALDIGAYAMSNVVLKLGSDFYNTKGPGIVIYGGGEKRIGLTLSGGNSVTASMYVKANDTGTHTPFLVLSGSPFSYSSLTAASAGDLIDKGSGWANDTFQKLTVKGHVLKTETIHLVLSGNVMCTSSFSDIKVR